jgi:hypothetical protein
LPEISVEKRISVLLRATKHAPNSSVGRRIGSADGDEEVKIEGSIFSHSIVVG